MFRRDSSARPVVCGGHPVAETAGYVAAPTLPRHGNVSFAPG